MNNNNVSNQIFNQPSGSARDPFSIFAKGQDYYKEKIDGKGFGNI